MKFSNETPHLVKLNWPLSKSIRLRHCQHLEQSQVQETGDDSGVWRCAITFSAHSTTHFDLPWALPLTTIQKNTPSLSSPKGAALLRKYFTPFWERAVVLDFRDRVKIVDKLIDKYTGLLNWEHWKMPKVVSVFRSLQISMEDISERIDNDLGRLKGKVLVIWTDWIPHFVPRSLDCSHPYFEGLHPFLVHPFLTTNAIRTLFSPKVGAAGVCSDTSTLEFPLLFIERTGTLEKFFLVRKIAADRGQNLCELDKSGFPCQVLHIETLGKGLHLGELFYLSGLSTIKSQNGRVLEGDMLVVPLPVVSMNDALLCRVFFVPSGST